MPSCRPHFIPGVGPAVATWRQTDDATTVHAIHRAVLEGAPAGIVRPDSLRHFAEHAGRDGVTLGCFLDDGKMIGYGVLGLRSAVVAHLAGLLDADVKRFCVLDGAAALPEWRGYGMHQAAIEQRVAYAMASERSLIGATVSPDNLRSLRSLLRAGLQIRNYAVMYGDLPRLIAQRDLLLPPQRFEAVRKVPVHDHAAHQMALGDGLVGFACREEHDGHWVLLYGHAV